MSENNSKTENMNRQRESDLIEFSQQTLAPFWDSRNEGFLEGQKGKRLYWVSLTKPEHTKAVLVVNGRIESVHKYQEVFWDLFQQGYDVYSFDHRGQGISERCCDDREIGHVEHFDDYIQDMRLMVESFKLNQYQQKFILAHSMGGAIAIRYLQTYPQQHQFNAVALSAPMMGIHVPWYLRPFSKTLACWLASRGDEPSYAPSQKAYYAKPFEINKLTHSQARYEWFRNLYEELPEIKLGGASSHWVHEAIIASQRCLDEVEKINIPVLLMQGSQDRVVDNVAQAQFIKKLNQAHPNLAKLSVMQGSRHEVLFETDELRSQALEQCLAFFSKSKK
ncbi:MAG: alpha/beta fold hydrolase [Vibrio sp.]